MKIPPADPANTKHIQKMREQPTVFESQPQAQAPDDSDLITVVKTLADRVFKLELEIKKMKQITFKASRNYTRAKWYTMKNAENARAKRGGAITTQNLKYDPRWDDFDLFVEDMGTAEEGQSLVQIYGQLPWSKVNVVWRGKYEKRWTPETQLRTFLGRKRKIQKYLDFEHRVRRPEGFYDGEGDILPEEEEWFKENGVDIV